MINEEVAKTVATVPEEMESYAQIRKLVRTGQYSRALQILAESTISQSTRQHLQRILETNNPYVIDRTFLELDSRIAQALCWGCWGD